MNSQERELESILRQHDLDWAIRLFSPSDRAAEHYLQVLHELERYLQSKNLGNSFTLETVQNLIAASPIKADAFLQALVSIRTIPMLCATWRLLQGMEIESIEMHYHRLAEFRLRVVLKSPYGQIEEYESNNITDVVFVRHLGSSTIDDKPFFDGFYPLLQT